MKKYLIIFGSLGTLTFLSLFIYFYKTSGKFRKSIIAAFASATFFLSSLTIARAAGEADAFTPQHQNRPSHRSGFFSGRSSNDGSGPGKPDDFGSDSGSGRDGLPQFPQTESIEETQEHLSIIDEQINKLEEVTDSDSESECASAKQFQVNESYKSNSDLKKVTKNTEKNKRAMKNLEEVREKLSEGEDPMKIGYKPTNLGNGFYYIRKPNARMVVKLDRTTGNSDIVAFGLRSNEKNMEKFAIVVNSQCDTKLKINPKAY